MAEKGFKLVATCCSGANGLAAANHPILTSNMGNINQTVSSSMHVCVCGPLDEIENFLFTFPISFFLQELMNHRNCGDYEEQRWAHYTEYVFFREPQSGYITPTSREL